jgi:uncharacterized phage infection (PIP) family protein YhgE
MPTAYQIALLLTRLVAAVNLAGGVFSILGAVVIGVLVTSGATTFEGLAFTLLIYGFYGLCGGIGVLVFSSKIATFASKF